MERGNIKNLSCSRLPKSSRVRDLADEIIDGIFYKQELARVEKNLEGEQFIVDRVIKSSERANKQVLVSWRGYPMQPHSRA